MSKNLFPRFYYICLLFKQKQTKLQVWNSIWYFSISSGPLLFSGHERCCCVLFVVLYLAFLFRIFFFAPVGPLKRRIPSRKRHLRFKHGDGADHLRCRFFVGLSSSGIAKPTVKKSRCRSAACFDARLLSQIPSVASVLIENHIRQL